MSSSASSDSIQTITNVVFGLTATTISIVTVWQGHRAWKMWRGYAHEHGNVAPDVELGIQSPRPTVTSLEAPEHDEEAVVASTAPSADQVGEDAEAHHTSASAEGFELQTTSPTAGDTETSLTPASVQGARVDGHRLPGDSSDDTQPASNTERRDFRPAAATDDL